MSKSIEPFKAQCALESKDSLTVKACRDGLHFCCEQSNLTATVLLSREDSMRLVEWFMKALGLPVSDEAAALALNPSAEAEPDGDLRSPITIARVLTNLEYRLDCLDNAVRNAESRLAALDAQLDFAERVRRLEARVAALEEKRF